MHLVEPLRKGGLECDWRTHARQRLLGIEQDIVSVEAVGVEAEAE